MTTKALEKEVMKLTPKKRVALGEKLLESVSDFTSEETADAWRKEVSRRVKSIRDGTAEALDADEVHAEVRRKLHAARRVSSAGRK